MRLPTESSPKKRENSLIIDTRTSRIQLRDDGIVVSTHSPNNRQTRADAQENVRAMKALCDSIGVAKCPLLVDMRHNRDLTTAARDYYSSEEALGCICATALLTDSSLSRIMANLFIRLSRSHEPILMFTSEERALTWLTQSTPDLSRG